ncbi:MAG: arsenate reductase ArsC, partial [Dysosmobacter sp.]
AEGQHSKLLSDLPPVDVVVTMGCNVQCPVLPCKWKEDWGLDDPTGQADQVFMETIRRIEEKVLILREKLR